MMTSVLDVAPRKGKEVRWVRQDERNSFCSRGWKEVSPDGTFDDKIVDSVGNNGRPGTLVLLEIPTADYKEFCDENLGGKQNILIAKSLRSIIKDSKGRPIESTSVDVLDKLPTEAEVRRAMKN